MQAMILAAGRGERLRPLTDRCPKPLLPVHGRSLIEWHLLRLARQGFKQVVINTAHLGGMIQDQLGNGEQFGLSIRYSREPEGALETAGGIATAQPWASQSEPFLVINGDVLCDWPLEQARALGNAFSDTEHPMDALLVMVKNPPHHPNGDFLLVNGGRAREASEACYDGLDGRPAPLPLANPADAVSHNSDEQTLTYSGLGLFHPRLFINIQRGERQALGPLLKTAATRGRLAGLRHEGLWVDVGTVERLEWANSQKDLPSQLWSA
jgi:MurNAc alpha-1-phosphate uridylyltransferase